MDLLHRFFRKTSNISKLIEMEVPHLTMGLLMVLLQPLKKSSHHLAKLLLLFLPHEESSKSIDLLMVVKQTKLPNKVVVIDHNQIALEIEVVQKKTIS